jgi:3-hydroxyisobutyrate dehydrogenase
MAGWLSQGGYRVTVYNRTAEKAERWAKQYQGRCVATTADAVGDAAAVFTCLGDDPDVREVVLAEGGVLDAMQSGSLFVDHTTASAGLAREIAAVGESRGIVCLDAPISGGQAGAENGALTVMVGGTEEGFARAEPMIDCYAKTQRRVGASGSGQLTKMCNQIAIAGIVQGLAEAINFGQRAGLDIATVIEVISKGAAQSWQMENRWNTMIDDEFDFGFAVEWMRKDLRICLDEARRNGAELPVAALVDQFYADVVGMGGKRWDTSSLIARLNRS